MKQNPRPDFIRLFDKFVWAKDVATACPPTQRVKIGAVVFKKNKIISMGYNKMNKTHPKCKNPYHHLHAEADAILGVNEEDLRGADIYIYRELRNHSIGMCKPCPWCRDALLRVGIKTVFYTDPSEKSLFGVLELN